MITITTPAAELLQRMRQSSHVADDATLRIDTPTDGVGAVSLRFVASPTPGDAVQEAEGLHVAISPDIIDQIDGATIDAVDQDGQGRLVIRS